MTREIFNIPDGIDKSITKDVEADLADQVALIGVKLKRLHKDFPNSEEREVARAELTKTLNGLLFGLVELRGRGNTYRKDSYESGIDMQIRIVGSQKEKKHKYSANKVVFTLNGDSYTTNLRALVDSRDDKPYTLRSDSEDTREYLELAGATTDFSETPKDFALRTTGEMIAISDALPASADEQELIAVRERLAFRLVHLRRGFENPNLRIGLDTSSEEILFAPGFGEVIREQDFILGDDSLDPRIAKVPRSEALDRLMQIPSREDPPGSKIGYDFWVTHNGHERVTFDAPANLIAF